jgi:hypothetical protein
MTHLDDLRCLDLPELAAEHRLHAVLGAALADARAPADPVTDALHWPATFFGLDRSGLFADCAPSQQDAILRGAGEGLLEEAWFIEKAGLAYTAKMALLSPTTEERMLYALFAADEATHFHGISRWLPAHDARQPSAFHQLLARVITSGSRDVLVFVVQVVLEGWGLRHYRALADASLTPGISNLLRAILDDEARHHGSGTLLCAARPLQASVHEELLDVLDPFLQMVRVGPLGVLDAVQRCVGPLAREQRLRLLVDLDGQQHARARLHLLRDLMRRTASADVVVTELERRGCFEPLDLEACT